MEQQALGLLPVLKDPHVPVDTKLDLIDKLKTHIKHHSVPDEAVEATFDVVRLTLAFSQLRELGLSTLSHLAKRMLLQQQHDLLGYHGAQLLPALLDRLGDSNTRAQLRAVQAVSELWGVCPQEVEALICDEALHSARANIRRGGMQWILRAYKDHRKNEVPFKFKNYVPQLVLALKDKDASARDTATSVLIDLFAEASEPAKADLQKQLTKVGIEGATSEAILGSIGYKSSRPSSSDSRTLPDRPMSSSQLTQSSTSHASTGSRDNAAPSRSNKKMAVPPGIDSAEAQPPSVPASTKAELDPAKPIEVGSNGQFVLSRHLTADNKDKVMKLDDLTREFQPAFEGRETEHNWPMRDKHVLTIRKLNNGNAPYEFTAVFVAQLKGLRDGILKAANSLRTSPCTNACYLIQELARTVGSGLDPMVEMLMETLIRLCGHTKNMSAMNANAAITTLYNHVSYTSRLLSHVQGASTDKNKGPRGYAQGWLKAIMGRHVNHKHVLEHSNGADTVEKIIKKGLGDPDPGVRDSARDAYWTFNSLWPSRGEAVMASLGASAQGQLLGHSSNPDKSKAATQVTTSKTAFSKSTNAAGARPSIKEAMLAKRREKERLERPASALATTSPVRNPPSRPQSSLATGTLSSAPIRPVRPKSAKKPEAQRPASPKISVKSAARKPLAQSPSKAGSPAKVDEEITMIMPSLTLGAPADITSRPKTADSGSSASASIHTRTLDGTVDNETLHKPLFEGARVGRGALEAPSQAAEDGESREPERQEAVAPSEDRPTVEARGQSVELSMAADEAENVAESDPALGERAQESQSDQHGTQENARPEPIVIRDEERQRPQSSTNGHPANGHAARHNQKENNRSIDVTRTGGLGERPLAELSESQTNNNNDNSNASTMRLVDSGIKRISSKTLDAHGFRKLQSTVSNNVDLLSEEKLVQLVRAIIPQIGDTVSPSDDRILTQQLLLLKTLSKEKKVPFVNFLPEIICNILRAMGRYDEQSHTQVTLDNNFEEFAGLSELPLQQTLDAALSLVSEKQAAEDPQSLCTLGHATDGVGKLLQSQKQHGAVQPSLADSVLAAAMAGIKNMDASIRKKSYGLAAEVYKTSEDQEKFWADVDELSASDKAMLHYVVQN